MDINARINWMPGMEFTAQTFLGLAEHWDFKQRLALQTALGGNRMGLIPDAPFNCNAMFVKNQLEIEEFHCMALLPSGKIVNAEENVQMTIPMLFGNKYYLTVGFDDKTTEFEKEGVPYVKPHYSYGIHTKEEVENADLFPLMRFYVKEGLFSIDDNFIPPVLLLIADKRFKEYIDRYVERLTTLSTHQNLSEGEGKRTLLRYVFMLKGYNLRNSLQDFLLLTQEIAQATDYHIVTPNREQPIEVPTPSMVDIQEWLQWLDDYLAGAAVILDGVVLEDKTIDYEALLAQAKAELYSQLDPELTQKMLEALKNELHTEMHELRDSITTYINDTVKKELKNDLFTSMNELSDNLTQKVEQMGEDLSKLLYEKLYTELFDNLYNALFVPDQENNYVPLI